MKRIISLIAAGGMIITMAMTSYAAFGWNNHKAAEQAQDAQKQSYVFKAGETEIRVGADADALLPALGTPVKVFEQDSCAYQGKDKVYTFAGYEISVFPEKGINRVSDIYIPGSSSAATPEGIHIGSSKDDMIKTYGTGYTEAWGVYKYTLGDSVLVLYTTNNVIDTIEYQLLTAAK